MPPPGRRQRPAVDPARPGGRVGAANPCDYDYNLIGSRTLTGPITDITDITAGLLIGSSNLPAGSLLDGIRFSEGVLGPSEFLQAVPEPGRAMLLAVAALGLLARRRRGGPGH